MRRQGVHAPFDLLKEVRYVLIVERQGAAEQGVENDSTAPDIHFRPGIMVASDNLRGGVIGAPTARFQELGIQRV